MATAEIEILTTVWTKITAAGQSGTCWKKSGGKIIVDHTDAETAATLPLSNTNVAIDKSKLAPQDEENSDVLPIPADNASDIYYALSLSAVAESLVVDVL